MANRGARQTTPLRGVGAPAAHEITVAVTFRHGAVAKVRSEARRLDMTVPALVNQIIDVVIADRLVDAVLDTGKAGKRRPKHGSATT